jgi:hypothetical protein
MHPQALSTPPLRSSQASSLASPSFLQFGLRGVNILFKFVNLLGIFFQYATLHGQAPETRALPGGQAQNPELMQSYFTLTIVFS